MKPKTCAHCAIEIEGKPVSYRGDVFCSDECCEEHTAAFAAKGGPADDDLDEDLAADEFDEDEFDDEDVGYKDDEDDELDFDDDDYDIKPDDF